ncbi:hypothetical protein PQR70_14250 [Paraburkholderia madseniana]|uniref:hypothetical protein n=1 Tax=Paraburkholderia madseniana TaxID=2599607 RepID=UPI0038B7C34C
MRVAERSLHWAVQKWLSPTTGTPVRVIQFARAAQHHTRYRYICVEALRAAGILSIFFFRHEDGSWYVFPPAAKRPAMNGCRSSA